MKKLIPAAASLVLVVGGGVLSAASPAHASAPVAKAAQAPVIDPEVVLPGRVNTALRRTERSLNNAEEHIDEGEYAQAVVSLRGVRRNMYRADKATTRQMNAVVDPEAEADSTAGPDSAIATLAVEGEVVQSVSSLFDTNSKGVVDGLTHALYRTMDARDRMLDAIIAMDPEGAGADYADGMADTTTAYDDEVASLTEALADDTLSAGGRRVLTPALAQSQATDAKVNLAFGGGE